MSRVGFIGLYKYKTFCKFAGMKKCLMISALALSVCLLGGCDFFRQLAGRPTSRDIAAKRERIEREAEAHQRRIDSLKAVQKQISDSLAPLDSLRESKESIISTRQLATRGSYHPEYQYYVMIGAFSSTANAAKQAAKAEPRPQLTPEEQRKMMDDPKLNSLLSALPGSKVTAINP